MVKLQNGAAATFPYRRFLKKLKIEVPYDPAVLHLGIYLNKMKTLT